MSEEIVQRLGFETGEAITNINLLKSALEGLNSSLNASANAIRMFNTAGGGLDKAIADLTGKVDVLAQKMQTGFDSIKPPQLTFDTSAALNQINQLTGAWGRVVSTAPTAFKQQFASMKASLADYVNQNNLSKDQVIQAFAGTLSGSTPAIQGLNSKVNELKNTFNSTANTAQAAGSKIGSFFTQLGRIIAFRAMISLLNELTLGMQEAVQSAANFTLRIGQIGAIMEDTTMPMDQVRTKLLELSSEFARPLDETTLGFYQALQNQLGTTAEAMGVFEAAAQLSAANVAPMTDSVNLLSSALKGWHLPMSEAGRLSGMFFQAIKIGRMEAVDLADVLGRIGPIAQAMGISIEEAMGAVAIMTQQGTKASTAITQLGALMTALMKPSKDLKTAMTQKWGVENAEQAIIKFGGLMGVLRQIEDLTGGTSDEIVKFTTNVRAVRAEIGLLGPNASAAEAAIKTLGEATAETAKQAAAMVLGTAGGQYKKSVVELANEWTKLGEKMTGVSTIFNEFKTMLVGWASSTPAQILIVTGAVIALGIALKAYGGAMLLATRATETWVLGLAAAHPVIAGLILAVGIGLAINSMMDSNETKMKQYFAHLDQLVKKQTETNNQQIVLQTKATEAGYAALIQLATDAWSKVNLSQQKEVNSAQLTQKVILATVKQRFDAILTAQQSYLAKLINAEVEAAQKIETLKTGIATRGGSIADKTFNNDLTRWSKEAQWQLQLTRGDELRSQALTKLTSAKTPEDVKVVDELLSRAQSYYDKSAAGTENDRQAYDIREKSINIDRDRNALDAKQIDLISAQSRGRQDQIGKTQSLLTATDELFKVYEDGLKAISKAKTPEDMQKGIMQVTAAWKGLQEIMVQQSPQAKDFLGLSKIHNEIVKQLQQGLPDLHVKVVADLNAITQQLSQLMATSSPQTQKILGTTGWLDYGAAGLTATKKISDGLTTTSTKLGQVDGLTKQLKTNLAVSTQNLPTGNTLLEFADNLKTAVPELQQPIADMQKAVRGLMTIDPADTKNFADALGQYKQSIIDFQTALDETGLKPSFGNNFLQAMTKLQTDTQAIWVKITDLKPAQLKLDKAQFESDLNLLLQKATKLNSNLTGASDKTSQIAPALINAILEVPPIGTAFDTGVTPAIDRSIFAVNSLQAAAISALDAINEAISAAASAASMDVAYGGVIHRAVGGPVPRWTDTISAMLSPGEVVVNAPAARQFYPQLQAMNSGSQPIFRDRGGSVTNVGDINVNVKGGDTSQQTIKEIALGLRRGIQRKTIKLN